MNNERKQAILKEIFKIHENAISELDLACKIKCAECCTRNVTMTSLEGMVIDQTLNDQTREKFYHHLSSKADSKRFQPAITVNEMADLCAKGETLPEEHLDPNWGKCPLLIDNQCSIYESRPFECRSFVSTRNCIKNGSADMPPLTININNLIRQYIEHIDADAASGNLTDVLLHQQGKESMPLISNRPISVLMIDPEFKDQLDPIMKALNTILHIAGESTLSS
jgi:Fe-S-cluster containining protein